MLIDVNRPTIIVPHPIHMHGHKFFVVAMERHVDNITLGTYLDNSGIQDSGRHDRPKISETQILLSICPIKASVLMHISIPSVGWSSLNPYKLVYLK